MQCNKTLDLSFSEYRSKLLFLAKNNLNPVLCVRLTAEDVVQETLFEAYKRIDYFEKNPDVPTYFKLRKILFQTITNLERKHLKSQKRDAYKELYLDEEGNYSCECLNWNMFADSITSPSLKVSRDERYKLLQRVLGMLAKSDRQIIELRHFDGMTNMEIAAIFNITTKNASIRYVRAIKRLKSLIEEFSGFSNE